MHRLTCQQDQKKEEQEVKAKFFIMLLLVGIFAVGAPIGAVAEELEEDYYLNQPISVGSVISNANPSDVNPSDRSQEQEVEEDPSWGTDSSITGLEGE